MRFTNINVFKSVTLLTLLEMLSLHFFGGDSSPNESIDIAENLFELFLSNNDIEEVGLVLDNFESSHSALVDSESILTGLQELFDEIGEFTDGRTVVKVKIAFQGPDLIIYSRGE